MPPLNWDAFEKLPGGAETNFEILCRALVRRHYGQYGQFAALAGQPGVEFHLKLTVPCSLGRAKMWYGWQCRWYDLPGGRALGSARRRKIEKAILTTHRELPNLTHWVLWTRRPLTKSDQEWFAHLKTHMRLVQWTGNEVDEHLTGEAEILRATYFGQLVLTPEGLAKLHDAAVAPIQRRWQPEVHQILDAERALRQALAEGGAWQEVRELSARLKADSAAVGFDMSDLRGTLADASKEVAALAEAFSSALATAHQALEHGDLDLLRQQLVDRPAAPTDALIATPRQLRSRRHRAALSVTNALADVRSACLLLNEVDAQLATQLIAVTAEAGCGKTQLAAQITAAVDGRPAGILLHGRDLHVGQSLDDLARRVVIHGSPVLSMEALVGAVDAAGQRAHRRLPIAIDGLNEAEDTRDWKPLLASLRQTLRPYPYVLVVCTIRTAFTDEAVPNEIQQLEIHDFAQDTAQAIRRYFEFYRIDAGDAWLPIGLFRHPLTLRLFCEVTNPTREETVGIERMPGSLTALFDRYLEQATERIKDLAPRTQRYFDQDIRTALDEIGTALWEEKGRSLDQADLRRRLGDAGRAWNGSIVRSLEQEGVLLRHPGEPPQGPQVAAVYDALAGHLVGSAILSRRGRIGLEAWLKEPATRDAFMGPAPNLHPLAADTFRALIGLVPRRLGGQQLWTLLDPPLRTIALRGAADLEGTYLDAATVRELSRLVTGAQTPAGDLFDRLWQTRGVPDHPLNACFLDAVLRPMSLRDRDLRWTEWIRRRHEQVIADLRRIEIWWRRNPGHASREGRLRARWVMWTLTSTVRELRDQATRALYWFGRRDPAELFRLTLRALGLNDPYVPERMLAAAYGVCMALHCRPKRPGFRATLLPAFARHVYNKMFAASAPHSTTHVLSREYARGIVSLGQLHSPSLFTKDEQTRTVPPFKDGGLRDWLAINDPNEGKYRGGNAPLGTDFANYTIGRLVPNRSNYDFNHEGYKLVVGQVTWRLYNFGYSLEAFGEIDKQIADRNYRDYSRHERPLVERYGKKYARIAYFEQYGLRKDAGLLETRWHMMGERPSDLDIDPSFPAPPHRKRMLLDDILGGTVPGSERWVMVGPSPSFRHYLVRDRYDGEHGPWLLIHALFTRFETGWRNGFAFIRSFFVRNSEFAKARKLLRADKARSSWLPDVPEARDYFAGEFPWRPDFPYSIPEPFKVPVGRRKVRNERVALKIALTRHNIIEEVAQKQPKWRYEPVYEAFGLESLVQHCALSGHLAFHRPSGTVPSKQLCERFGLWLRLPSWDMYDPSERRASITTGFGKIGNDETTVYMRRTLLERYLAEKSLTLVWIVYGERQWLSGSGTSAGYKQYKQLYWWTNGTARAL